MKWICTIILIFFSKILFGQNYKQNTFSILYQPTFYQIKENNFCGLKHKNFGSKFQLSFLKTKDKYYQTYNFSVDFVRPESKYEDGALSVYASIKFQYDILFPVNQLHLGNFQIGGLAKADYKFAYYPNWDESHLYWANFIGFGFKSKYLKTITENKNIYISIDLPILGMVSRTETDRYYKIEELNFSNIIAKNHQHLQLSSVNNYFDLNLNIGINLKYSQDFSTDFVYFCEYANIYTNYSKTFRMLQHGLALKLNF